VTASAGARCAGQLDAVLAAAQARAVLVSSMPTGRRQVRVYQLAGLLIDGPTVVVSPLIALQRDQLARLDQARR
jgi:ATP-dependent DNA helicase RecQ